MLYRRRLLLLVGLFAATTLSAQATASVAGPRILSATLEMGGPERPTLESVRACPRYKCEVTMERGTLDGTRIRVGDSVRVIPLYLTGEAAYRFLAVAPKAKVAANKGRHVLRRRLLLAGTAFTGVAAAFWAGSRNPSNELHVERRLSAAAIISGGAIYIANRQQRTAERSFEEAVRLYNLEVRP